MQLRVERRNKARQKAKTTEQSELNNESFIHYSV